MDKPCINAVNTAITNALMTEDHVYDITQRVIIRTRCVHLWKHRRL